MLCEKLNNLAFFSGFHRHGALRNPLDSFTANFCHPDQCIYLDDLGINLKPARELGMTTIKVIHPEDAIQEVRNLLK